MKPWLETWECKILPDRIYRRVEAENVSIGIGHFTDSASAKLAASAPLLVRALLECWHRLRDWPSADVYKKIDAALTAAGLPDQASRDAARAELAGEAMAKAAAEWPAREVARIIRENETKR